MITHPMSRRQVLQACLLLPSLYAGEALAGVELRERSSTQGAVETIENDPEYYIRSEVERVRRGIGERSILLPMGELNFSRSSGNVIRVDDLDNLSIIGNGTQISFSGVAQGFQFNRCRNLSLSNFAVNYRNPPYMVGSVELSTSNTLRVRIVDAQRIDRTRLVKAITTYDATTRSVALAPVDAYDVVSSQVWIEEDILQIRLNRNLNVHAGQLLLLRTSIYDSHAFIFTDCARVQVDDIKLHSAPGMGLVFQGCKDIKVAGLAIEPAISGSDLISVNADGLHCADCGGSIYIRNSRFLKGGDDCINIHSIYHKVNSIVDEYTIIVGNNRDAIVGNTDSIATEKGAMLFREGSHAAFSNLSIVSFSRKNNGIVIRFDTAHGITDLIKPVFFMSAAALSNSTIENCTFSSNRGRGILTHCNSVIAHCHFFDQSEEAIQMLAGAFFLEGPNIYNCLIQNCNFDAVGKKKGISVVSVGAEVNNGHSSTECEMINRNIRIDYNEFSNLIRTALDISSVSGLKLMNNEFVSCASPIIQMRCSAKTHLARNRASEPNVIVFDAPTWQADRKIEDNANMDARSSL